MMCKRLLLRLGTVSVSVVLNGSATAEALCAAAPFTAEANRWGHELFFATPVAGAAAEATAELVERGTVAFWPPGRALCLFFGPTPLSVGDEIRPASAVAVVGRIAELEALESLEDVHDGMPVEVAAAPAGQ